MARILVVDDEHLTTEMLRTFLGIMGHEAVEAHSGKQMYDRLAYETFDAILLDIMLPDVNGIDLCKSLRAEPNTMKIPIIMISAYIPPLLDDATRAGADGYLVKPVNLGSLREMLTEVGVGKGTP